MKCISHSINEKRTKKQAVKFTTRIVVVIARTGWVSCVVCRLLPFSVLFFCSVSGDAGVWRKSSHRDLLLEVINFVGRNMTHWTAKKIEPKILRQLQHLVRFAVRLPVVRRNKDLLPPGFSLPFRTLSTSRLHSSMKRILQLWRFNAVATVVLLYHLISSGACDAFVIG